MSHDHDKLFLFEPHRVRVRTQSSDPRLNQFVVVNHTDYYFGGFPEHSLIEADNLRTLVDQVKCASFEFPSQASNAKALGSWLTRFQPACPLFADDRS